MCAAWHASRAARALAPHLAVDAARRHLGARHWRLPVAGRGADTVREVRRVAGRVEEQLRALARREQLRGAVGQVDDVDVRHCRARVPREAVLAEVVPAHDRAVLARRAVVGRGAAGAVHVVDYVPVVARVDVKKRVLVVAADRGARRGDVRHVHPGGRLHVLCAKELEAVADAEPRAVLEQEGRGLRGLWLGRADRGCRRAPKFTVRVRWRGRGSEFVLMDSRCCSSAAAARA